MELSIIIPTLNEEKYVRKSLIKIAEDQTQVLLLNVKYDEKKNTYDSAKKA